MPFGTLRWPHLGLSLLKACIIGRGIPCDVAYFNFDFAERLGLEHYHWLADDFAFVLGGERLFAKHYFAERVADRRRLLSRGAAVDRSRPFPRRIIVKCLDTARHVEPFL